MKNEWCSYKPALWCMEEKCSKCSVPDSPEILDNILPISLVTHVHCKKCGWQGTVEECMHKNDIEVGEYGVQEIILDLCPDCLIKKAEENCVEYD
jgi:hypothetical protein